ncbi:MAG: hypothetical protein ACLTDV_01675 [Eubacterium sp.]
MFDPNIFYNIAQARYLKSGRIRYSLQTGQDDDVHMDKFNESDKKLTRADSCRRTDCIPWGKPGRGYGRAAHKKSWCRGCLYTNSAYSNLPHQTRQCSRTSGEGKGEAGEAAKTKTGYT